MKELIKIKKKLIGVEETNSVNARDLYSALEIKKDFTDWIKTQIQRAGLEKNIDYVIIQVKSSGGRPQQDYIITTDASKHIAMMSQGQKARDVRDYFIAVEKEHRANQIPHAEFKQVMPVLQTMVEMMKKTIEMQLQMMQQLQQVQIQQVKLKRASLNADQLDDIKLAVNSAAKALAECHGFDWGRAVKEVYTELNGRMGVFAYYHIAPSDFEDALRLLERMKEVKEEERKTGERVRLNIKINIGGKYV